MEKLFHGRYQRVPNLHQTFLFIPAGFPRKANWSGHIGCCAITVLTMHCKTWCTYTVHILEFSTALGSVIIFYIHGWVHFVGEEKLYFIFFLPTQSSETTSKIGKTCWSCTNSIVFHVFPWYQSFSYTFVQTYLSKRLYSLLHFQVDIPKHKHHTHQHEEGGFGRRFHSFLKGLILLWIRISRNQGTICHSHGPKNWGWNFKV